MSSAIVSPREIKMHKKKSLALNEITSDGQKTEHEQIMTV